MQTVGQIVQEAIELIDRGSYEQAINPTVHAIDDTIKKSSGHDTVSEIERNNFLKENWPLIVFMGLPTALPLPMNIPFGLKRIVPQFNVHHGAFEIVLLVISETLKFNRLPDAFGVNSDGKFEIKGTKLLLPSGLHFGLLGSVIFSPLNKDEEIGEEYWLNISSFKMFVSELFGRKDLADRILKLYEK